MSPIDKDNEFYEEIDDEEMLELVLEAQREAQLKSAEERNQKTKRPFPRWIFWLMAFVLFVNTVGVLFEAFSIPAIEFVKTSARLSAQEDIAAYKKAVVEIHTDGSRGTGFSISAEGTILTNYHVIKGNKLVTVAFPKNGRFTAEVVETYPDIDLAVLEINGEELPHLQLAKKTDFRNGDAINFIGNPLGFTGIANEGHIIDLIELRKWTVPVVMMEAPVYRGNSGSPVFNQEGQVIGVVFATLQHEDYGKVGLFVPIDELYSEQEKDGS